MKRWSSSTFLVIGLVIIAALIRIARNSGWLPLPPNVAPITAMALLSGALLPRRWTFVVPLSAMLVSDLVIGFYSLPVMLVVYGAFAVSNVIGLWLRKRQSLGRIFGASLLGSTVFFVLTNTAVWAFQAMYPHSVSGLIQAFVAGLPFFRNTVIGDLGFSAIFFGVYAVGMVYWQRRLTLLTSSTHG